MPNLIQKNKYLQGPLVRFELGLLALFVLLLVVFFRDANVDLHLARLYFHPETPLQPWPEQNNPLWKFFYFAAPVISLLFALPSLLVFVGSYLTSTLFAYRWKSLFLVLVLAVGPGLLINSIFKPLWGRPRPRQVLELGGQQQYLPFWKPGRPGDGMSFPCGHCSIGFLMGAAAFVIKDKRRKLALVVLTGSTGLGLMMGVARLADGAHFISDTLAAGVMTYLTMIVLYYFVVKVPTRPLPTQVNRKRALQISVPLLLIAILAPMLGTPFKTQIERKWSNISELDLELDKANFSIELQDQATPQLQCDFRGFGLPKSTLVEQQILTQWQLNKHGFFTDLEGQCHLTIPANLTKFSLHLRKGGYVQHPDLPSNYQIHVEQY